MGLVQGTAKLLYSWDWAGDEEASLYDLSSDPAEREDLSADAPGRMGALMNQLTPEIGRVLDLYDLESPTDRTVPVE